MATRLISVVLALFVAVVGASCQPSASSTPSGKPAQKLTVTMGALPQTGDANLDSSLFASPVYRLMYDSLVDMDSGKPTAALAESWEQKDELTWVFKLRKGVKFQNGEPFNAAAVKWNLEWEKNPANKSRWADWFSLVDKVDVIDENTVQFHTTKPSAILLSTLVKLMIMPPKYFQEVGQEGFNKAPIGTGSFKVTEWKQDDTITLQANKEYWGGVPAIETITFKLMPEASARVASLEAGESQILYALPPEQAQRVKDKGLQVISNSIGHSFMLPLRNNVDSPLKDPRVRQAINYAVDKDLIVKELLAGYGQKLEAQVVGQDGQGFDPSIKAYPFDPEKAKKLLADAGFPSGFTVKAQGSSGRYIKDKEVEEAVVAQLAKIGIKVELEILESGVWLDKWQSGTTAPMFDVALQYAPRMDIDQALPSFITTPGKSRAYTNDKLDELYRQQQVAVDTQKRAAIHKDMAKLLYDDPPCLYLFQVPGIYAAAKNVNGLDFRADYSIKDITKVSIGQ